MPSRERSVFLSRDTCITCGSRSLDRIAGGRYCDEPLRGFIARDPWAENPLPYLQDSPWELVCCHACEQMFHRWVLDDSWQALRFERWMGPDAMQSFARQHGLDAFDARYASGQSRMAHVLRLERLTRDIRGADRPRLLDFGCGHGEFAAMAALSGFDACGVDWDAHRLHGSLAGEVRLFRGLGELAEADAEPFHAVTLFEVLEHLVSPREVLRALRARMVAGGILVLEVPDCTGTAGIMSATDYARIHPLDHINAFVPMTLERIATMEGFARIEPPAAWITTSPRRLMKTAAKLALRGLLRRTTQAYFRLSNEAAHA